MKNIILVVTITMGLMLSLFLFPPHSVAQEGRALSGEELWTANCNRCHAPRSGPERSDVDWDVIVSHMRVRAGLTGSEARSILSYLQSLNNK